MKKYIFILLILFIASLTRLYSLDKFPSGFNSDEASLGYNAYSLLETGRDEHGATWPLVFRSFDDYKPPLYVYITIPFVKLMGLNVYAVRLPSAICGVFSVLLLYLLTKELFKDKKYLPELSALMLALSPWHIHFSRGAWEVNISTFLILAGVYFLQRSLKNINYLYLCIFAFVLSLYTYHSARIISPLIAGSLFLINWRHILLRKNYKVLIIAVTLGVLFSLPIFFQLLSKEGQSRFSGVSIFADPGPLSWVHEMRRIDPNPISIITKVKFNRYSAYSGKFVTNYLSHFSPQFLFVSGDRIDRSRVPGFGQLLPITAPFLLIGIVSLILLKNRAGLLILSWLLVSPIAASMTFQSPHALRSQNMIIPLTILISFGLYQCLSILKTRKTFLGIIIVVVSTFTVFQFTRYLYSYYYLYPRELPIAWQYGFDQVAAYTQEYYDNYDHIIISTRYDQPYILLSFFTKYPPDSLQSELVMSGRDNFGFSTGLSFGKYEFRKINFEEDIKIANALIVTTDEPINISRAIGHISSSNDQLLFTFISTKL